MNIRYEYGDRVTHVNHGAGTVLMDKTESVIVEFDVKPDGWEQTLEVSHQCLKPL